MSPPSTLDTIGQTQERLVSGPRNILVLTENDIPVGGTRFSISDVLNHLATRAEPDLEVGGIALTGKVLQADRRQTGNEYAERVRGLKDAGHVVLMHYDGTRSVPPNREWYGHMAEHGIDGVMATRYVEVPVTPRARSQMKHLAEVVEPSHAHGLYPLVGPVLSTSFHSRTPREFAEQTGEVLSGLYSELELSRVDPKLVGIQVSHANAGEHVVQGPSHQEIVAHTVGILRRHVDADSSLACLDCDDGSADTLEIAQAIAQRMDASRIAVFGLQNYRSILSALA